MSSGSEQELAKARFVIDVQAKLQTLLETLSESAELRRRSRWPRLSQALPVMSAGTFTTPPAHYPQDL